MTPKLTKWFRANVRPVHVGVYERDDSATSCGDGRASYSHWDGIAWSHLCYSARQAAEYKGVYSEYQFCPWRGLASDPAVSK